MRFPLLAYPAVGAGLAAAGGGAVAALHRPLTALALLGAAALAALAAGFAFRLGGGHAGALTLPDDLVPLVTLALAYLVVSRGLLELVGSGEALEPDFAAAAAEAGLGAVLAMFALNHP